MTYLGGTGTNRRQRLLKLVLIYGVIAAVVYGLIYLIFLAPPAGPSGGGNIFPY